MGLTVDAIEQWWKHFEQGELDVLPELVRADADIVMPGGMRFTGPTDLRPALEAYLQAFPTMRHHVASVVEQGNQAAVELRIDVEHTGAFVTPMGEIPPSGNRFTIESCDVVTIDDDGRIASWHVYTDMGAMLAQMQPAGSRADG